MLSRAVALVALLIGTSAACRGGLNRDVGEVVAADSELASVPKPLACPLAMQCTEGLPALPEPSGFRSKNKKNLSKGRISVHRARDVVAVPGQPIWIIGKFTYSYLDANLIGEKVDIYLSESCQSPWKKIGETVTTKANEHETVEGVRDDAGRVFVELGSLGIKSLPIGRHRVLLVVPADNSSTELFIDIVDPATAFVVTDIDGTLTASEYAGATEAHTQMPEIHAGSVESLTEFYNKGYHILYLTARAEWFTARTRAWLKAKGYPPGVLRTTSTLLGASGAAATVFKAKELDRLKKSTGIVPTFAFGNKASDVTAFGLSGISPTSCYYYMLEGDPAGGTSVSDFHELAKTFSVIPNTCKY